MNIVGKIWKPKGQKFWLAEVPLLAVMSQGTSKKDALLMIADAVKELAEDEKFNVISIDEPSKPDEFELVCNDTDTVLALILKRLRNKSGRSVRDVIRAMGVKSTRGYSQYEQGERSPSLDTFLKLIEAVSPDEVVTLDLKKRA